MGTEQDIFISKIHIKNIRHLKDIDIPLVVVGGKTDYQKEIDAYIEENQLEKRIHFLQALSLNEIAALYQMATIFVYPSVFEGFGIPIIEALYSKTPVITSKGGCFSEAGGPDSIYVNPLNISELHDKILELLNSENKREEMALKGYKFVQKFNDEIIAHRYHDVYTKLIND